MLDLHQQERVLDQTIGRAVELLESAFEQAGRQKIYVLTQMVGDAALYAWSDDYLVGIYQKQFITQAALCRIHQKIDLESDSLTLLLGPVEVEIATVANLTRLKSSNIQAEVVQSSASESSNTALEERVYYSPNFEFYENFNHFFEATSESVSALLTSFWKKFETHNHPSDAYAVFGLKDGCEWREIQRAYRQLASKYHPDKGGDPERFIEIRQAFEILKRLYFQ